MKYIGVSALEAMVSRVTESRRPETASDRSLQICVTAGPEAPGIEMFDGELLYLPVDEPAGLLICPRPRVEPNGKAFISDKTADNIIQPGILFEHGHNVFHMAQFQEVADYLYHVNIVIVVPHKV